MKRLNLMIDEETLRLLRQLAEAEKETVSNYLRRLIRAQTVSPITINYSVGHTDKEN